MPRKEQRPTKKAAMPRTDTGAENPTFTVPDTPVPDGGGAASGDASASDPFRVLGVAPGATASELKRAYRTLSARYHPDALCGEGNDGDSRAVSPEKAAERFLAVQRAYDELRDRHSRALWESRVGLSPGDGGARWSGNLGARHAVPLRNSLSSPGDDALLWPAAVRVARFWREQRDWLRTSYWVVSIGLGIVIVALSLSPPKPPGGGPMANHLPKEGGAASGLADNARRTKLPTPAAITDSKSASTKRDGATAAFGSRLRDPRNPDDANASSPLTPPARLPGEGTVEGNYPLESISLTGVTGLHPEESRQMVGAATIPQIGPDVSTARPIIPPALNAGSLGNAPPGRTEFAAGETGRPSTYPSTRWHGSWTATCLLPHSGLLYVGELQVAGEGLFRWRQVPTEGTLHRSAGPDESPVLRFRPVPDAAVSHRLSLREQARAQREAAGMLAAPGSSPAKLSFPRGSKHTPAGCLQWQLYRSAAPPRLEGLWVLTADAQPTGARIVPAHLQLRIERRGSRLEGAFEGQYTVPVASIAPLVEFRFAFPAEDRSESIPWQDDAGSRGAVSLVAVSASRLAVHWVRHSPSPGRPQLSSGVSILRRME